MGDTTVLRKAGTVPDVLHVVFMNDFMWTNSNLSQIVSSDEFYHAMFGMLEASNFKAVSINDMVERTGWFGLTSAGDIVFKMSPIAPGNNFHQGSMPPPPKGIGKVLGMIHTHPASGISYTAPDGSTVHGPGYPSDADIETSKHFGYPGLAVTGMFEVWGYEKGMHFP